MEDLKYKGCTNCGITHLTTKDLTMIGTDSKGNCYYNCKCDSTLLVFEDVAKELIIQELILGLYNSEPCDDRAATFRARGSVDLKVIMGG
jgi:hypothetical protein